MSAKDEVSHSIAATRLVNPPGVEIKLTVEQLWKALEMKVRKPQLFLTSFFKSNEILSDDGTKVVRKATTVTGGIIDETCYIYKPTIVYFEGVVRVTNIISYNESGELLLTYSFCNGVPDVKPDSIIDPVQTSATMGKRAVEHTLETARAMVQEGKL